MYPRIRVSSLEVDTYVVVYVIAFLVASVALARVLERNNYPRYLYPTLPTAAILAGVVGSKAYYLFETLPQTGSELLRSLFTTSGSGWYGGFALGVLAVVLMLRLANLPLLRSLDVIIPVVPLGQVIGRLGCFLAGCCGGRPSSVPWAVSFPEGVHPGHRTVHPTQLYEMVIYSLVALVLWRLRYTDLRTGFIFAAYLVLSGAGRFIVEFYRLNPKVLLELTGPQVIALLGICLGFWITARTRIPPRIPGFGHV